MTEIKLEKRFPHIPDEDVTRIFQDGYMKGWENARKKAIPIELYEQIKGERDVAIEQLKSLNVELFEKPYRKAIPIEWIEKWGWKNGMSESMSLRVMIEDWEKENERP